MTHPAVIYRWVAESRRAPHKNPRRMCRTRQEARNYSVSMTLRWAFPHVARRLNPAILASGDESAWLYPEGSLMRW